MSLLKQNFELNEFVFIHGMPEGNSLEGATGTILGKGSEGIVDFYIVLLDKAIPTHKAVLMVETCLRPVKQLNCIEYRHNVNRGGAICIACNTGHPEKCLFVVKI